MDLNGGSSDFFPLDPLMPHSFGGHFLSHIISFIDNSRHLYVPGSLAIQEAFNCISKVAGALLLWSTSRPSPNRNYKGSSSCYGSNPNSHRPLHGWTIDANRHNLMGFFCKISRFSMKQLCEEAKQLYSIPALSLAAALIPPFDLKSSPSVALPLEAGTLEAQRFMDHRPCEVGDRECGDFCFPNLNFSKHVVEARTGIEFPTVLDNIIAGENSSIFTSEPQVLVGTGSRIMTIVKIKSLKVYAFGFYVHPLDICKKLGPKYASIPACELNKSRDFYADLLREDINMTVRLVVSCNGIKINTVRDAFEKSLRARLTKTNPDTDYRCLQTFGSMFSQDIPLHVGTTITFRRTADGQFITEIGGKLIGAVHSKDLCRAFFDMYIGDIPVSEHTKEEIGENVASIIKRC